MSSFSLQSLIFPNFVLISSIGLISFYFTRNWIVSISTALLKSVLFFCYFAFFFDGTFTLKDDWTYFQDGVQGVALIKQSSLYEGLLNSIHIFRYSGDHKLYSFLNVFGVLFFGEYYFSTIVFNIIFSVLVAGIGYLLFTDLFNLSKRWSLFVFIYIAFHPTITVWSTFINIKDIFVLMLHAVMIYSIHIISICVPFSSFVIKRQHF
jgi:hypothetical protein